MSNFIILTDTRQQKESYIIKEFDKQGILHIQTKLDSADYMAVRYDTSTNTFFKDYSVLIDTKKDLLELSHNLCNTAEHARLIREIERARELGCEDFIFLIGENKIKTSEDIDNWTNKNTRVKGSTLRKVMQTFKDHHGVRFIIVPKKQMGARIVELLK